ncbi:hypothetical protein Vafri_9868, partial [Volvox africanus]
HPHAPLQPFRGFRLSAGLGGVRAVAAAAAAAAAATATATATATALTPAAPFLKCGAVFQEPHALALHQLLQHGATQPSLSTLRFLLSTSTNAANPLYPQASLGIAVTPCPSS